MRILEDVTKSRIYGLMGNINITTNNENYRIINGYKFKNTVEEYLNNPKSSVALKMVSLNDDYLPKKVSDLSPAEIKKVNFAHALIENKEYLIFDYFEKELTTKEKEDFKRLFTRLTKDYHKTILIFTNDLTFIWDISSAIFYVDNSKVINTFSSKDSNILNYVDNPSISKFITLLKKRNISIEDYKSPQDLLKAIYRLKENPN